MSIRHLILSFMLAIAATATAQKASEFTIGADIGWGTEYAARGEKFYNWNGEEGECTAVMRDLGFSAIRIRVWVDPEGAGKGPWCGRDDVLRKALLAKAQGMDIMIDFHYSDWWADPAKQNIPASWDGHSYKKMLRDLDSHTRDILTMLRDNDIDVRWVQVGNEISNGMLWSVEMDPVTGWEKKDANGHTIRTHGMGHIDDNPKQYAGFFKAGYDAVKAIYPEAKVIVHLDNGWDRDLYDRNLGILRDNGAQWDIVGMSLYPYWSMLEGREPNAERTIVDCIRNIRHVAREFGTDVIITETGYEVDEQQIWKMQLGRRHFSELIRRAKEETDGHCLGIFYWEPECKPSQYKLGAFTEDGHPTDILRALRPYARHYDRPLVTITTSLGDIVCELYNETPLHRDNFLAMAQNHKLDGTSFHRVIKDFMIQGGDQNDTTTIAAEIPGKRSDGTFNGFIHRRGTLCAAREGDSTNPELRSAAGEFYIVWGSSPASAGRHPYVTKSPYYDQNDCPGTPWLDGGYTVFGEVVEGLDIVDAIQQAEKEVEIRKASPRSLPRPLRRRGEPSAEAS